MTRICIILFMGCVFSLAQSQDIYSLKSGKINFFAGTSIEDVDATNEKVNSFINVKTGEIVISIPNKEFHFKRSLMEEHFNENYMETDKFPKSEFKGKILDIQNTNLNSPQAFRVTVVGLLTIHGIQKERTFEVTLHQEKNLLIGNSKFQITLTDYNIERPKILWEKLAENVDVTVDFIYEPYKK